ncbi:MAG: response regulator transcription factor [Nitrosomonadales bacterium]|nr:response regulator transcription factor [Nitrosomonadales bacterium]
MQPKGYTVYMVEDDASVRDALGLLLGLRGYAVSMFGDAESFLAARKADWRGCALIDIRMPGMDGLALQKELQKSGCDMPVIVMTGHGDVDSARDAFRSQAVDFLEKPVEQARLYAAIDEAFVRQAAAHESEMQQGDFSRLLATLTPREKEVMELVVIGRHNREIAELLGISARTVEVHKARMMAKLQVAGVPELVRMSLTGRNR